MSPGREAEYADPVWIDLLPRNADGEIKLTQPLAIDLGLLHSRDYQTEFERVYSVGAGCALGFPAVLLQLFAEAEPFGRLVVGGKFTGIGRRGRESFPEE